MASLYLCLSLLCGRQLYNEYEILQNPRNRNKNNTAKKKRHTMRFNHAQGTVIIITESQYNAWLESNINMNFVTDHSAYA